MITAFIANPGNLVNTFNCQHWHFLPPATTPPTSLAPLSLLSSLKRKTEKKEKVKEERKRREREKSESRETINKNMHLIEQVTSQNTFEWLQNVTKTIPVCL